ncbi:class I SAM-dependent methyltransferase [Natronospira bacteriovora]|uniref:Methyltransferase domain-containing protein n=1 Tax=Natronospira bacteriovora TaxID=3069753 RepID=A0ABU0W542_9GAMM|nr:methyltransferase domain-containing protein [Natronospira sp. AB-CW4]MDQ2069092.1 methyltransferase domain-containing protein [Natronospira sp. AB-CW4]
MDTASIKSAYRRYARYYDRLFGRVFAQGRQLAINSLGEQSGKRILEVGVGTGLSLPDYQPDVKVVGIDISSDMLAIAQERARSGQLEHVEALLEMDAENLSFDDNSFDAVIAMYVASVVPNPGRLMAEMARVCKPGGDLLVINHFASENPILRGIEWLLSPLSRFVGFRPSMDLSELPEPEGFERIGIQRANLFGYWKLVHFRAAGHNAPDTANSETSRSPQADRQAEQLTTS